jgi:DNA-binding transcriptional LysR family regulator
MNFLNIEYFLVAARELNFSKAAEKLYISPQSLSTHIAKLENELGVDLFYRDHPMRLTYAGEILVKCGQEILDKKNQTVDELRDIADSKKGKLSVGISHTRGLVFLPLVLPKFHEEYPGVEIKILEAPTSRLDMALANGEIDLMISLLPFSNNDVESVRLVNEEILMLIPEKILEKYFSDNKEKVLSRLQNKLEFSLLKDCPFLMLHDENRVRVIADKVLNQSGVNPRSLLSLITSERCLSCRVAEWVSRSILIRFRAFLIPTSLKDSMLSKCRMARRRELVSDFSRTDFCLQRQKISFVCSKKLFNKIHQKVLAFANTFFV